MRLKGTTSNPLGLGALVRVRPDQESPEQVHLAGHMGNPYGVSEPLIFVGLGDNEVAEDVRITWPSGFIQELKGLSAGTLHEVQEPETLRVSPWSRRLEASGSASAFVEVYARTPGGELKSDAELTLSITHGLGTLSEGVPHEGGMRWEVAPPGEEGTTRFEARIDGVAIEVRPRVFWY